MILELTLITVSSILGHNTSKDLARFKEEKLFDEASGFFFTEDEESVMGKLKQIAIDRLKEEGVELDPEDPIKTQKSLLQRAKAYFGVSRESAILNYTKNVYTLLNKYRLHIYEV